MHCSSATPLSSLPGEQEELGHLTLSLRLTSSKITEPNLFFFDYKLGHLANASLNADLEIVQRIVAKTSREKLRILLSTETTAIITHLGIERTGTALQMALYSHDEELFAYLAKHMSQEEVQRQCKEVFDQYSVADYDGLIRRLETDAKNLCLKLEVTVTQDSMNRFKNNREDYLKNNPVHNPYILQRLYDIYKKLPTNYNQDCLFSEKGFGLEHGLGSKRWLQHLAQGIYYLVEKNEPPGRSFICRDSSPPLDIRTLIPSRLGVDSFMNIFGVRMSGGPGCGAEMGRRRWPSFQNLCQAKTASFQKLCSERKCSCAAMMSVGAA